MFENFLNPTEIVQVARRCARQAEGSGLSALVQEGSEFSALTQNPLELMRLTPNLLGLMRLTPNPYRANTISSEPSGTDAPNSEPSTWIQQQKQVIRDMDEISVHQKNVVLERFVDL